VFLEIAKVLKPGRRPSVCEIALKRDFPPESGDDPMAYVGCIAGAVAIEEYRRGPGRGGSPCRGGRSCHRLPTPGLSHEASERPERE
jgi:hypothetical protein